MTANATWTKRSRKPIKWAAIGALGLVGLYVIYVVVVLLGAALGLWPLSTR